MPYTLSQTTHATHSIRYVSLLFFFFARFSLFRFSFISFLFSVFISPAAAAHALRSSSFFDFVIAFLMAFLSGTTPSNGQQNVEARLSHKPVMLYVGEEEEEEQ